MPKQPRPYQANDIAKLRQVVSTGVKRVIYQAETGLGKSIVATTVVAGAYLKGRRCLFIARGRELVLQMSQHFTDAGIVHGVMMHGCHRDLSHHVQVVSKDTLLSWCVKNGWLPLPDAEVIVIDECHASMAASWLKILVNYPNAIILGLSATPARADGRPLRKVYQQMVCSIPTSEGIRQGYLVPTKVFAPHRPDLKGVKKVAGDWSRKDLGRRMDKPKLVGDIVNHWQRLGENRQTIAWCCTIEHAQHLADEFRKVGVDARHIDSKTMDSDKATETMQAFKAQQFKIITSVGMFTHGVDAPSASCGIMARPTQSFPLFRQMVGRPKRPFPGKKDWILLDHAGNVYRHGHPDEDVSWSLDATGEELKAYEKKKHEKGDPPQVVCSQCFCMYSGFQCPNCGHTPKRKSELQTQAGNLVEVNCERQAWDHEQKKRYWLQCLAVMANKNRSFGAAAHMFHGKIGEWPQADLPHQPPPKGDSSGERDWGKPVKSVYPQYIRRKEQ